MGNLIVDIESDGLLMEATQIWCIIIKDSDTGEVFTYGPNQVQLAIEHLQKAQQLVGHNIILYDLPLIKRLHDVDLLNKPIVDTLLCSRLFRPDRDGGHSLEAWGQRLGYPKGVHTDFTQFSEAMLEYCLQDVEIAHKLYTYFQRQDKYKYQLSEALQLEHDFARIIAQQILNGFALDVSFTKNLLKELQNEYDNVYSRLVDIMPRIHRTGHYLSTRESGRIISESDVEYTYISGKAEKVKTKKFEWIEANPRSRKQIAQFFTDKYSWKPTKKTDKDNPVLDEAALAELDYPEAKLFSRMFRLNKQIAMIGPESGWLSYEKNGRVHGNVITNGAVTGRCTHSKPNLAQVDHKNPKMLECWIAPSGKVLVNADAEQLEARVLAHYLAKYDNGSMAQELLTGDFHERNRIACGFDERKTAKTFLYAFLYGAGSVKLGNTAKGDLNYMNYKGNLSGIGSKLKERLIDSVTGIDKLQQQIALTLTNRDYLLSFDGRPLYIRSPHAALNTLLQGGGAVIMKYFLVDFIRECKLEYKLVGNIHDSIILECDPEVVDEVGVVIQKSMQNVTKQLDLKCPMEMNVSMGKTWNQTYQ